MKKILFLALIASTLAFTGFSQGAYPGYPLYGTAPNSDRTYRSLQLGTTSLSDSLGATVDTIQLIPGFVSGAGAVFHKDYILNLKDSCALAISKLGSSFQFSTMTIYVSAPSIGGAVYFCGEGWAGHGGLATQWAMPIVAPFTRYGFSSSTNITFHRISYICIVHWRLSSNSNCGNTL